MTKEKRYKYLGFITALYIMFQLVSDVTAGKIIHLGFFTVSVTVLYFPFTYIIGDILTEVYGYVQAKKVVWMILLVSILSGVLYSGVVMLPSAIGAEVDNAYALVLGQMPRILVGGWIAVFIGVVLNNYILAKMKILTKGKYLWMRTIVSTIFGEGINTILFYIIALYGVIPDNILISSIISGWFLKVIVEIIMTPVTYWIVNTLKKIENEDYYDKDTNFNPLVFD